MIMEKQLCLSIWIPLLFGFCLNIFAQDATRDDKQTLSQKVSSETSIADSDLTKGASLEMDKDHVRRASGWV